ncbi:MAG: hypothetical protein ACRDJH_01540 [Thermomicrobiales bacterium]
MATDKMVELLAIWNIDEACRLHASRAMYYELWDVEVGNGIIRYEDDYEMASLVRVLINAYGDAYAKDLDLTIENEAGTVLERISGRELVEWAVELADRDTGSTDSPGVIASRRGTNWPRGRGLAANPAVREASRRNRGNEFHKKD